jgi:hypothetical protein
MNCDGAEYQYIGNSQKETASYGVTELGSYVLWSTPYYCCWLVCILVERLIKSLRPFAFALKLDNCLKGFQQEFHHNVLTTSNFS